MKAVAGVLLMSLWLATNHSMSEARNDAYDPVRTRAGDSLAIRKTADSAVRNFLTDWQRNWLESALSPRRPVIRGGLPDARRFEDTLTGLSHVVALHNNPKARVRAEGYPGLIIGASSKLEVGPGWLLAVGAGSDATDSMDNSLLPERREAMQRKRDRLLLQLDSAQRLLPGDLWIFGQRVRFLVDAHRVSEAVAVAHACHPDRWWCAALSGYALERQRAFASADSAFATAIAALPPSVRCNWTDVRLLLAPLAARAYAAKPCSVRDSLATAYWWLASPLLADGALRRPNVRRVTHYSRKVLVMLHSALDVDEHFQWRSELGGDSYAELLVRYGWPTNVLWLGARPDSNRNMARAQFGLPAVAHFPGTLYSQDRVAFGATWETVQDPLQADSTAWLLNPPPGTRTARSSPNQVWVPDEHMRYGTDFIQLSSGQTVLLRRQRGVRIASAIDVGEGDVPYFLPQGGQQLTASLVVSDAPDVVEIVGHSTTLPTRGRVIVDGTMRARPVLMDVEVVGTGAHPFVARARRGLTTPAPLSDVQRDAIAVSQPALFIPDSAIAPSADADAIIPRLLGSTTVARGSKIGVFWESYGVNSGDSVRFTVSVMRASAAGLFRRVATALRLADAPVGSVAIAWQDPRQHADATTPAATANTVPIVPRSIVLDVGALSSGSYWIEVVVNTPGKAPAQAHSLLNIR